MATVDREEIIVSKAYEGACDFSWTPNLTEPAPSGIINVNIEHAPEFIKSCGYTSNNYVLVSQRSDLGLAYQKEYPVRMDMKKWITMLPHMDLIDFENLGYDKLVIPPRCDVNKCNMTDNYAIKCDSFTWSTVPQIPPNIKRWHMTNCMTDEPHISGIPFGVLDDESADKLCEIPAMDKTGWLYVNFQTYTLERFYLKGSLGSQASSCEWMTFVAAAKSIEDYFKDIAQHRYVICPDGNGVDCFRTWESLYLGSIPIVKRSRTTEQFSDLPILLVDDLFSITIELLEEKYEEILLKKDNLEQAKLSYWKNIFKESKNENCN